MIELEIDERFVDEIIETQPKGMIPSNLFIQHFLPYFIGEKEFTEEVVSLWLRVAGGPSRAVDVVDSNKDIIVTIPPFYDTGMVEVNSDGVSIFTMLATAQHHDSRIPGSGERYREQATETVSELISGTNYDSVWKKLKEMSPGVDNSKTHNQTTTDESDDDFLVY